MKHRVRKELIAFFRLAALYGWHESVANHISVKDPDDESAFLINGKYIHFLNIQESNIVKLPINNGIDNCNGLIDRTAWALHSSFHEEVKGANCVAHLHPKYITVLSTLSDPELYPIDQTTARFYKRISYDEKYSGMVETIDEGHRLASAIGNNKILIMRNHGVVVATETIADAFDTIYHLERACMTLIIAYTSGKELSHIDSVIAEKTALSWESDKDLSCCHFQESISVLL